MIEAYIDFGNARKRKKCYILKSNVFVINNMTDI